MGHGTAPPPPGAIRPYRFPAVTRRVLDSGLAVWACPIPGRAMLSASLVIATGAAIEPVGKAGEAALAAWALTEGTESLDSLEFADRCERIAADVGAGLGWHALEISIDSPVNAAAEALALAADALKHPAFREEDVARIRGLRLNQFRYNRADPSGRAHTASLEQLYTADSRYSLPIDGRPEVVAELDPDALRDFHARCLSVDGAVLVVVGDMSVATALDLAEANFGDWRCRPEARVAPGNKVAPGPRRVVVYHRPGAAQSVVTTIQPGVPRSHPDQPAIEVLGRVVGGLFTSRLNLKLREEKGYTYGAHAGFEFRRDTGIFSSSSTVETKVTAATVADTIEVLEGARTGGVTAAEVSLAVDFELGNWPLGKQAPGGIRDALAELAVHRLPDDHWDRHLAALAQLGPDQVSQAAAAHLRPDRMRVVVVGDAERVAEPLRALGVGEVEIIDDPDPGT